MNFPKCQRTKTESYFFRFSKHHLETLILPQILQKAVLFQKKKKKSFQEEPIVYNADILRAVNALTDCFSAIEQQIAQNSVAIVNLAKTADFVAEEMKSADLQGSRQIRTRRYKLSRWSKAKQP